jgi:hypothetical protein
LTRKIIPPVLIHHKRAKMLERGHVSMKESDVGIPKLRRMEIDALPDVI